MAHGASYSFRTASVFLIPAANRHLQTHNEEFFQNNYLMLFLAIEERYGSVVCLHKKASYFLDTLNCLLFWGAVHIQEMGGGLKRAVGRFGVARKKYGQSATGP